MGKHTVNDKKNGTESRENLGQIECIEFQTGAIVNPFEINSLGVILGVIPTYTTIQVNVEEPPLQTRKSTSSPWPIQDLRWDLATWPPLLADT